MFEHNAGIQVGYQELMVWWSSHGTMFVLDDISTPPPSGPSGLLATRHKDTPKQLAFKMQEASGVFFNSMLLMDWVKPEMVYVLRRYFSLGVDMIPSFARNTTEVSNRDGDPQPPNEIDNSVDELTWTFVFKDHGYQTTLR